MMWRSGAGLPRWVRWAGLWSGAIGSVLVVWTGLRLELTAKVMEAAEGEGGVVREEPGGRAEAPGFFEVVIRAPGHLIHDGERLALDVLVERFDSGDYPGLRLRSPAEIQPRTLKEVVEAFSESREINVEFRTLKENQR